MSVLKLKISTARPTTTLVQRFETPGGKQAIANRIVNYVTSLLSGTESAMSSTVPPQIVISIQENETQASGTFTLNTVIATDAVSINGVTFTCVASGAGANEFNVGVSDNATATNLAAAINASVSALVSGYVTASASAKIVTVTSAFYGISGNQTLIASADLTIVASGATLAGGAADATTQTLSF